VCRHAIAALQLHAPKQHYKRRLRPTDVKDMFLQMRDHLGSSWTRFLPNTL